MKIYVGNISDEVTEEYLRERFKKYGEVESVTMISGLMGLGDEDGMAFVEMPEEKRAKKAIKRMNRKKILGNKLNVHVARAAKNDRRNQERGGGRRSNDNTESK